MEQLRKQCMAWLEQTNPLRGLSISRAGSIYDMARKFGSPRLQYTYNEIEKTDPVVYVCCDRRESALAGLEWSFIPRAHADETLAQEQADALTQFTDGIDNFTELLSHLDGAFFRGFAHAQPIWDGKTVAHVNLLDSWNFLTDPDGNWYWNPACHETPSGLDTVEGAKLVSLTRRRSIDYPILFIYIRKALGERDYGRFIERHGIPHAAIIMGPGTEEKDKAKYLAAANAWNNGQDLALPNGSDIKLATEARGTDPFTPFVEHQDKYTVLLATGATLTTLAQADTGSLAGGAHMEVWREIVARDGVKIAEALNRDLFRRYLELEFPGRPMAAKFVLSNEKKQTADEVADLAGKLKTAGYLVDQQELEEKVGLKLVKDESSEGLGGLERLGGLMHNKQPSEPSKPAKPSKPESDDILRAFAADMSPAGKAVKELLDALESGADVKQEAASLLSRIPSLLPDDPLTAATIADAMAEAFGAKIKNKELQPRGKTTEESTPGSFAPADGGSSGSAKDKGDSKPDEFGYSKAQREKIGSVGTWRDLGLPAMRDIPADPPVPLNKMEEARKRIETGEQVTNPFGETLDIDKRCLSHIDRKGRNPEQLKDKLQHLDAARETFEHPHEIWHDEKNPKNLRSYVRITLDPSGRRIVNGVDEGVDHVLSWHTNDVSFDHYRKGKLLWIRG